MKFQFLILTAVSILFVSSQTCEDETPPDATTGECEPGFSLDVDKCCRDPTSETPVAGSDQTTQPSGASDSSDSSTQPAGGSTDKQTVGSSPPPPQQSTQPPCVDLLNPRTGVSDCPALAYLCSDSVYYDLMTEQCPKTCNRCGGGGGGGGDANCVDKVNPKTGVSDCPQNAGLCNNSVYYSLMTDQCPKTCNRCNGGSGGSGGNPPPPPPSGGCQDKTNPTTGVSDCPQNAGLCNNSIYQSLMRDQCPKTCGFC